MVGSKVSLMKWIALVAVVAAASSCTPYGIPWDVAVPAGRREIGVQYLGELEELPRIVKREATATGVRVWVRNMNPRPISYMTGCRSDAPLRLGKFWDGAAWVASKSELGCTGSALRFVKPGEVAMLSFRKFDTAKPQQVFVDFADCDTTRDGYRSSIVLLYEDAANRPVQSGTDVEGRGDVDGT
jgi:hypothetical protein